MTRVRRSHRTTLAVVLWGLGGAGLVVWGLHDGDYVQAAAVAVITAIWTVLALNDVRRR